MKKFIYLAAAMAAATTLFASCNKEEGPGMSNVQPGFENNEIAVNTSTKTTKGYVTGETFFDTAIAELHAGEDGAPSDVKVEREMKLSAFLHPQTGSEGNYFVDYTYAKGDDGKWHHDPKIYWPLAGTLDFLAYSAMQPFDAKDVAWNEKNASESVVLTVLEDRTQDDIVYCSVASRASTTGADAVPMQFKHAQAWLEFQIKVASADMKDKIAIEEIVIENIYNDGELTIENNNGDAKAEWNFRKSQSKDVVFDDDYSIYGSQSADFSLENAIDNEINYMDMLLPEQAKTSFVIKYVLAGQPNKLEYRYTLGTDNWLQGNKYVYEIQFNVNELTVAPTVKEYVDGTVTDLTPSEII
ncbi:MAG: fimbrillin family protein [Bacteroidales bacterium]|nr:fimbrillin family protein [Candidatus Cacconaster scatequi]